MKSFIRKFAAIGLAIFMMAMFALPASAAPATIDEAKAVELDDAYYKTLESDNEVTLTGNPKLTIQKFVNQSVDPTQPDMTKPISGVQFKYVKVGNLYEIKVNDTNYVMAYGITQEFANALGFDEAEGDYKDQKNLYFKDYSKIEDKLKDQTKDTLKDFLVTTDPESKKETNKPGVQDGVTGEEGNFEADLDVNNKWGLYLVIEYDASNAEVEKEEDVWEPVSITQIQAPFIVSLPTLGSDKFWDEEVTANVKNSTDTADVEKKIVVGGNESLADGSEEVADTDTTSIGDTVHFRLKGTILDIPAGSHQSIEKYVLTDVISQGLDPVLQSVTGSGDDIDPDMSIMPVQIDAVRITGSTTITTLDPQDYTVSVLSAYDNKFTGETDLDDDFNSGKMFTITLEQSGLEKLNNVAKENTGDGNPKEIYFYYSAIVNKDAVIGPNAGSASSNSGNPNKVKLNYKVSNSAEMVTRWDKVTEFTFGIDVTKQFEGGQTDSPDASAVVFKLYKSDGIDKTYYSFLGSDGTYHTPTVVNDAENATELKLNASNQLSIKGLDELPIGTYYYLEEISTAPGYNLLNEPVKVEISANVGNNSFVLDSPNPATNEYVGTIKNDVHSETGIVSLTVINTQGFQLPSTGGAGIWMFVIGGVIIIAAGGAYFLLTRKKKQ